MDRRVVKEGLGLMFWGNIVALFGIIPIAGVVALIIGGVMQVMGIWKIKNQDQNYSMAFVLLIVGIVVGVLSGDGFFGTLMKWASIVVSCASTYVICTGTANCVGPVSPENGEYCLSVRKQYVLCMVLSLIISVLSVIPLINILAAVAGIVVAILELIASIRYLIMLYRCKNVL